MADVMEIIKGRRSVRSYESRDVSEDLLAQLYEAVQWSPSWANTQCWELVVVRGAETKQKLQETMSKGNPATKAIVDAPVVIAVCGKLQSSGYYKGQAPTKFGDWFLFDLGLATQNLCLTAHALGLATVIAGLFDHDAVKGLLQVPDGYEVVALIPVGYPAKASSAPKRRSPEEFVHQEQY